jgi:hypothetical protein
MQKGEFERFRLYDLFAAPTYHAIQTIHANYLTATGEGGKYDNAIHTDATQIGSWEQFRIVKCGDLGTGYQYTIIAPNNQALVATNGGGLDDGTPLGRDYLAPPGNRPEIVWARFRLVQQSDGSYGLRTSNGVNYLTALGGGGKVEQFPAGLSDDCSGPFGTCVADKRSGIFHTDATQVQAWEKFRFVDQGDCRYTIQTSSGFFMGLYNDPAGQTLFTTRRSIISENEKFQLLMSGLASPPVPPPQFRQEALEDPK